MLGLMTRADGMDFDLEVLRTRRGFETSLDVELECDPECEEAIALLLLLSGLDGSDLIVKPKSAAWSDRQFFRTPSGGESGSSLLSF